tara:strand:- start:4988 stop:5824 length:837 start_codon:yes stop_codon:yes gene_type:complete
MSVLIKKLLYKSRLEITKLFNSKDGYFYCNERENIGDSMVPYILEKTNALNYLKIENRLQNQLSSSGSVLFSIGSVLQWANKRSVVWGSGLISKDSKPKGLPRLLAVRGKKTREVLEGSYSVDLSGIVLGDPGLLISKYYSPKNSKDYKYGIVLHYVDKRLSWLFERDDVLIIDIETTNIELFCDCINRCENILSSSLHGLVIADSYSIPNAWIKLSDNIFGDDFKFYDYFSIFEDDRRRPFTVRSKNESFDKISFVKKCPLVIASVNDDLLGLLVET